MATAEVSFCTNDYDITTCTICLEQFNNPKYLPCLHTFCESCIATYITSAFENDNTSIDCPVCRAKVPVLAGRITPEEWTKQMPLNFLLVGLIEKHKVERTEKICMSCERFDANTKSEATSVCIDCSDALCATCTRCHKSSKLRSNHEIVPISDISKDGYALKSFRNMCSEHKNKELELFCVDHDCSCCSICVSVKHRKCENVLTIEEAAKKFRESNIVSKTENEVSALLTDLDSVLDAERSSLFDMGVTYNTEMQKCDQFWNTLQQGIEELKSKWTKAYQKTFHSEKAKLELTIRDAENRKKAVTNTKQILEATLKEASDVQLMIEIQKLKIYIETQFRGFESTQNTYKIEFQFIDSVDYLVKNIEEKIVIINDKIPKVFNFSSSKCVKNEIKNESVDDFDDISSSECVTKDMKNETFYNFAVEVDSESDSRSSSNNSHSKSIDSKCKKLSRISMKNKKKDYKERTTQETK
ncbi:E3 ubiquitin-protein ligase TRIM56-like [Mytilus californianus]|uniref:E3 ubiquitin-protein ligase TRIM56-like n=1 Tax=Mytilus californianus TaxID=6549 RepID=UPI0022450795|nr:E3 ubiquitin-protein ligase TRIM56-like [Mytilus californianus]